MNNLLEILKQKTEYKKRNMNLYIHTTIICLLFFNLAGCGLHKDNSNIKKRIINPWTWQDKYGFVQANDVTDVRRMLFCAGQISVDANGNLLHPDDMEKQINQIFANLKLILKQANLKLSDVVRFTYYTTDITAFTNNSHVLAELLKKEDCKPATSLIGVASLSRPGCVVEFEATLVN